MTMHHHPSDSLDSLTLTLLFKDRPAVQLALGRLA